MATTARALADSMAAQYTANYNAHVARLAQPAPSSQPQVLNPIVSQLFAQRFPPGSDGLKNLRTILEYKGKGHDVKEAVNTAFPLDHPQRKLVDAVLAVPDGHPLRQAVAGVAAAGPAQQSAQPGPGGAVPAGRPTQPDDNAPASFGQFRALAKDLSELRNACRELGTICKGLAEQNQALRAQLNAQQDATATTVAELQVVGERVDSGTRQIAAVHQAVPELVAAAVSGALENLTSPSPTPPVANGAGGTAPDGVDALDEQKEAH